MKYLRIALLGLFFTPLFSDLEPDYKPIYAGTLLNFYSQNAAPGRLVFDPLLFATRYYGFYNQDWKKKNTKNVDEIELFLSLETGINDFIDINLIVAGFYSHVDGFSSWRYEDTWALLGFQVSSDIKNSWVPDFRIVVGQTYPTGKFDQLNPEKLESDASGTGSVTTYLIGVWQKIFYTFPNHPFNINLNLWALFPNELSVRGFNVYGGGFGTKGRANPVMQYVASLGVEVTLDKHWGLGTNIFYEHDNSVSFKGNSGISLDGTPAKVGLPSSEQLSLAPSIEYNFDQNMSILGGVWFTVAGRNSSAFVSAVFEYFYYF